MVGSGGRDEEIGICCMKEHFVKPDQDSTGLRITIQILVSTLKAFKKKPVHFDQLYDDTSIKMKRYKKIISIYVYV